MHERPACHGGRPLVRILLAPPVIAALLMAAPAPAAAQRVEPKVRDWMRQHRLLLVPDEEKALQQLKVADLDEFVRIFWARRDPSPGTPENEYRSLVEKARADADARFGDDSRKGSLTACGQVYVLLGDPDEVIGRELRNTFDTRPTPDSRYRLPEQAARNATRDGARRPELWTYKSNSTRTFRMPGGDLKLQFDDGCEFGESGRAMEELARVAGTRVLHAEIGYEFDSAGRLRPLAAPAPAASAVRALLDRQGGDFTVAFEPKVQVPGQGGTYTAGILCGPPGSLAAPSGGGEARLKAIARATPAAGVVVLGDERDVVAEVAADGSFVTSYGFTLPPGRYAVAVALLDPASGRGAIAVLDVESPDFGGAAMAVSPLAVLAGLEEAGTAPGGPDPYAAFAIGSQRLRPRAGNVLTQADSLSLLVLVHNAAIDPATGKASLKASFGVLREGTLVAKGKEQAFETAGAVPMVGPISLAPFTPGRYVAHVEIADEVGKASVVRETPFEVRPPKGL